jgi:hypothetical protein
VTQGLWRGVEEPVPTVAEGTPAELILPNASRSFLTTEARTGTWRWKMITVREKMYP